MRDSQISNSPEQIKRFNRALQAYRLQYGKKVKVFDLPENVKSIPTLPPSLLATLYGTYLNTLHAEHEHAFIMDEIDSSHDPRDIQNVLSAEIEIVEDIIHNLRQSAKNAAQLRKQNKQSA